MHDVAVAVEGDPPAGVVMDGVEVGSVTSSNRIREKAAADRVVVNRIEGAAWYGGPGTSHVSMLMPASVAPLTTL